MTALLRYFLMDSLVSDYSAQMMALNNSGIRVLSGFASAISRVQRYLFFIVKILYNQRYATVTIAYMVYEMILTRLGYYPPSQMTASITALLSAAKTLEVSIVHRSGFMYYV